MNHGGRGLPQLPDDSPAELPETGDAWVLLARRVLSLVKPWLDEVDPGWDTGALSLRGGVRVVRAPVDSVPALRALAQAQGVVLTWLHGRVFWAGLEDAAVDGEDPLQVLLEPGQLYLVGALAQEHPELVCGWSVSAEFSPGGLPQLRVGVPVSRWPGASDWLAGQGFVVEQVAGEGVPRLVDRVPPRRFTQAEVAAMDNPEPASGGA